MSSSTISKNDLVLVSGASGFVGSHTAKEFLIAGYRVRGTVRSEEKGQYLKNLFEKDGLKGFEYVLVGDITADGAFDEAVKGVDGVAHTASPFYVTDVKDPQELIDPAVKGTTGILTSVQKHNPSVKRVVITSSVAAIMSPSRQGVVVYTDKDWNNESIKHVEENGQKSLGFQSYLASKTLAEQALWKFIEDEKPSWNGVAINPSYVLGEVIHEVAAPEKLNTSVAMYYQWASGQKKESDLPAQTGSWVDVKDVARAHVKALEVAKAAGNRYILSATPFAGQHFVDIIHKKFPDIPNVPTGKPDPEFKLNEGVNDFDGSKTENDLGFKFVTIEESVVQMTQSIIDRFGKF